MRRSSMWGLALGIWLACPMALAAELEQAFYSNSLKQLQAEAEALIERDPANREAYAWLARAHYRQGRFAQAEAALAKAGKGSVEGLLADGDYALFVGDDARARTSFDRALKAAPDDLHAMWGLAAARLNLGQFDVALALAKRAEPIAARSHPYDHSTVLTVLGGALGLKVKHSAVLDRLRLAGTARSSLERAIAVDPANPITHFALGRYYMEAPRIAGGDPKKAVGLLRKAVALDPYFFWAQVWLIRALERSGQDAGQERAAYRRKFSALPAALDALDR